MEIILHRNFRKQYKKLRAKQPKIDQKLILFQKDPFNYILNNHVLGGKYKGYRSINITGDLRAFYEPVDEDTALFVTVDTHSNLYK